jgi:nucleoside-diphosphate-sugar epimerase
MRALVTGASGFVGRNLVAHLRRSNVDTFATSRFMRQSIAGEIWLHLSDATNGEEVHKLIVATAPDVIFHLAGVSSAPTPMEVYATNAVFAAHLFDACGALSFRPVVVVAGSAAEYGPVDGVSSSVSEEIAARPNTLYGISKLAQTHHSMAAAAQGLPVVVARLFNPIGPGMPTSLALGSFAQQIASFDETGGLLRTGDLNVERDFIDVSEVARILSALAQTTGAYGQILNVCTGFGWNLGELTERLVRLSNTPVRVEQDLSRTGNSTSRKFIGDPARLKEIGLSVKLPEMDLLLLAILKDARKLNASHRNTLSR